MVVQVGKPRKVPVQRIVGLIGGAGILFALFWFVSGNAFEHGDAFALAKAYAVSSPEVQARVGVIVSTTLAPGEARCVSETAFPPTGDATFTMLVTGTRDHAKLDVRATRDAAGWHLFAAKVRATDAAPFAVPSGCWTGNLWGPGSNQKA